MIRKEHFTEMRPALLAWVFVSGCIIAGGVYLGGVWQSVSLMTWLGFCLYQLGMVHGENRYLRDLRVSEANVDFYRAKLEETVNAQRQRERELLEESIDKSWAEFAGQSKKIATLKMDKK